eukprot:gene10100-21044_t
MGLDFDHGGISVHTIPIFNAIHSEEFRSSLLNSISVAIPVTVDYFSEIFTTSNIWENGRFQRGLLLISMWLTDAVILAEVIPNENVAVLELFFAFLGCFFIAFIILWILVFKWLQQILKFSTCGIPELLASDRNIMIILIPSLMFGTNYTIICVLYGGSINANTTSSFLTEFTYAEAAFMLMIFMIQGRTSRLETIQSIELVKEKKNSCLSSLNILDELLDYDKLDAGILSLDRTLVSAVDLLQGSTGLYQIQARHAEVALISTADNPLLQSRLQEIYLHIDKKKMERALNGIIANAIKVTPKGGSVVVSSSLVMDSIPRRDGSTSDICQILRIEVTDTGGTAVVTNYNNNTTSNNTTHTHNNNNITGERHCLTESGLGLMISKAFIDLHNGNISVSSLGLGFGCTFTIDIPIHSDFPPQFTPVYPIDNVIDIVITNRNTANMRRNSLTGINDIVDDCSSSYCSSSSSYNNGVHVFSKEENDGDEKSQDGNEGKWNPQHS